MATLNISPAVFNPIYLPYLDEATRTQIFYGGAASGKSRFLAQRCVYDLCKGGRNYLITRKVASTIRRSCFNEIVKTIHSWGVDKWFSINQSDLVITCHINGHQALFVGCDDVEKIKSITPAKGVLTDVWMEEATENDLDDLKQLEKRLRGFSQYTKRITMSFNPIMRTHWIFHKFFSKWDDGQSVYKETGLSILKTTYRDNKFLAPDDIEGMKNETDRYYKDVYVDGNWGVLGAAIFKNWKVEDLSGMKPMFDNYRNGCDFGFAADPAALYRAHYDKKRSKIYVVYVWKDHGITNDVLAEECKKVFNKELVVCDSAEPKSVAELQNHGVKAVGARKGRDSVVFGIQWLQQQEIIIDVSCQDLVNEMQQYKWKEDSQGNVLPIPVGKNDHIISSMRYAHEFDMGLPYHEKQIQEESFKDRLLKRFGKFKQKKVGYARQ